jgi:energy-coupling factor transporter ATP-binding protein EcfA2
MRIKSLTIEDFRGFHRFRMKNLGRVNLIVGANNCGKTTVLEAIEILTATEPGPIWWAQMRRGERTKLSDSGELNQVDIRRLFRGHEIDFGKSFRIEGETEGGSLALQARIQETPPGNEADISAEVRMPSDPIESAESFLAPRWLTLSWSPPGSKERLFTVSINSSGGVGALIASRSNTSNGSNISPARFITTSSMTAPNASALFERIVLTPEEDLVTDALRLVEPSIERLASAGSNRFSPAVYPSRGGLLVRLKDMPHPISIGSMGDGAWHILGLALNIVHSIGGILLVDEIDTGLHHTAMDGMWKFICDCSRRYHVQVFATAHSRDCYQSLAAICRDSVSDNSEVTIQRIERGRDCAVSYTEQEIIAAAKRGFEVR